MVFSPTDDQIDEAARHAAFLEVFRCRRGKKGDGEPELEAEAGPDEVPGSTAGRPRRRKAVAP